MNTQGIVKNIENGNVTVSVVRKEACSGDCGSCNGCPPQTVEIIAKCDFNLTEGSLVEIESDSNRVIFGLFVLFLLPTVIPIFGYLIFSQISITVAYIATVILLLLTVALIVILACSKSYILSVKPTVSKVIYKK